MFGSSTVELLEGGCALIIGTGEPGGKPRAGRGWGLDLVDGGPRVRLLLDAEDDVTVANARAGGPIAITAADVTTLRSIQLKGHVLAVEPVTPADEERADRYCDAYFGDIVRTDEYDREICEQMRPLGYVACTVEVVETFDQTPGPGAGRPLVDGR